MKPEEASTLVGFLKGAFPSMTSEQMEVYESSLLSEDATFASRAILDGIKEWKFTPKYAEIVERIRMFARAAPGEAPAPAERGEPPPFWVKRWIVARYITSPPDLRVFHEEEGWHPEGFIPEEGWMPARAWVEEAEALTPAQVTKALLGSMGVGDAVTLPLIDSWDIQPAKGKPYPVNANCANPTCGNDAEHGHHLVRRSQAGDIWWIRLPDGIVIGNVIGLCAPCHALVTNQGGRGGGHGAAIRWINGDLWWCAIQAGRYAGSAISYLPLGMLSPQTPHAGDDVILRLVEEPKKCPTCGGPHGTPRKKQNPARKRKTWTVQVPADEEDGAQVLDDIVDGVCAAFELDGGGALTRYHALARAGAFVLVNRSAIPKEAKG